MLGGGSRPPSAKMFMLGGGSRPPSVKSVKLWGGQAMFFLEPPPLGAMFTRPHWICVPV